MSAFCIIAVTVTMAFHGLLYFQSHADGSKHAVVIDARGDEGHHHDDPHIAICHADKDGNYDVTDCFAHRITLNKGEVVSIGLTSGTIATDDRYDEHVPVLKRFISGGDVADDVKNETGSNPGVLAFVSLPGGTMTTWSTFPQMARLTTTTGEPRNKCFAQYVVLRSTVSTPFVIIDHVRPTPAGAHELQSIALRENDLIFVSNTSGDTMHRHFPLFSKILTKDSSVKMPVELLADRQCNAEDGKGQFSDGIEKALARALTAFRVPNGDCGPTGP